MDSPSKPKNNTGLKRLYNAFFFSIDGFKACFRTEQAFRQEIYLSLVALPLAFWFGHTAIERVLLITSILLILMAEMLNTAIERVVDRISLERHALSKDAKDIGSAIVLLALINAIITWVLIITG